MAFRRGSPPEEYPVIRGLSMGPPPGLPPPLALHRTVYLDDRPGSLKSPPDDDFPSHGLSPPSPRRFVGDNPPQRSFEGPPPGYQESPLRRFPSGRSNPPPQSLSPEDSPPYRYSEKALRRYPEGHFSRPFPEDAPLPDDSECPPLSGFLDEAPRRSDRTHHAESESPSPPPGYFRPPRPPPGEFLDESPRRFGGFPRQFKRYADDDSPPTQYADEAPRRLGGDAFQRPYVRSPPSPGYAEDQPRSSRGTHQFRDDSPPRDADEAPRRVGGPSRRGSSSPPAGVPRGQYDMGDSSPPPALEGAALPPQLSPQGSPPTRIEDAPGPPGDKEDPQGRLGAEPRQFAAGADATGAGLVGYIEDIAQRQGPGGPSPELASQGFGPPPGQFPGFPPGYLGIVAPPQLPEGFPLGAPPPGPDPRLPLGTSPRFPPAVFAGALGRPPSPGRGSPIPEFLFHRPQKKQPSGYTAHTPPREPPPRRPDLEHDAIFTADVMPIELDDKLKEVAPHRGNPGSSTGDAWKDMWAGLFFILQIGGIAALCIVFGLQGLTHTLRDYREPNTFHINDWLPQLCSATVTGAVFAIMWQNAIRMAPVLMILVTVWTGAALTILVGIFLIATGRNTGLIGIAFFFSGLCQALYAFVVRERIPFAGEMLKKVVSVCNTYPSTYGVSYSFLLVSLGWVAIWIFGFSGSSIRPRHALIMAGLIASLVWTMQVFRNIVHVTVAGTVGLFYFQEHNMPLMTTPIALLRACTTSLGSICFGSLLVPLVEAPCHALRRINSQAGASEFIFSCVVCFLAIYQNLIRYFNKLGYIQVALYGKPFLRASKDTWDMIRAQKVNVLVDDDLTSTILMLACGIGGSLSALVGGIYTFLAHKSLTVIITIVSYLIGSLLTYITMAVVESAVATYYVCFAEDPDSLQRYDGPFYERMWVRQMELTTPVTELSD